MKSIRPTKSKTRKGVLAWLTKFNPFFSAKHQEIIYNAPQIVAVHVNRYTGQIVYWEGANGYLMPFISTAMNQIPFAA